MRVDSIHSEAYKVLGGITRAGHDDTGDIAILSTLEPSFDILNVKFDVAFAVDPLYHQTSVYIDMHMVNKIEVQYDKVSKQVDVQVLKETLWECLQESPLPPIQVYTCLVHFSARYCDEEHQQEPLENRSIKELLASFPDDCKAAGTTKDISAHLCFICLLHLANEHNLRLIGSQDLDDLTIHHA